MWYNSVFLSKYIQCYEQANTWEIGWLTWHIRRKKQHKNGMGEWINKYKSNKKLSRRSRGKEHQNNQSMYTSNAVGTINLLPKYRIRRNRTITVRFNALFIASNSHLSLLILLLFYDYNHYFFFLPTYEVLIVNLLGDEIYKRKFHNEQVKFIASYSSFFLGINILKQQQHQAGNTLSGGNVFRKFKWLVWITNGFVVRFMGLGRIFYFSFVVFRGW